MSNYRVRSIPEHCMGCGLCRLACQVAHSSYPNNIIKAMKTGKRPVPRMTVDTNAEGTDIRTTRCRHCEDPECLKVCVSGAISKNENTGIVTVDQNKCVGCWSCVLACPFGAVIGPVGGEGKVFKCDLCIERGVPACAGICPNEALALEEFPFKVKG